MFALETIRISEGTMAIRSTRTNTSRHCSCVNGPLFFYLGKEESRSQVEEDLQEILDAESSQSKNSISLFVLESPKKSAARIYTSDSPITGLNT